MNDAMIPEIAAGNMIFNAVILLVEPSANAPILSPFGTAFKASSDIDEGNEMGKVMESAAFVLALFFSHLLLLFYANYLSFSVTNQGKMIAVPVSAVHSFDFR